MTGALHRQDRTLLRMYGRDPLKMIQGLATNDIAGAPENSSVYTVFLTPKGKLVGDARVARRPGGDIWIEADVAAATNIEANLKKFVPPLFARFESMSAFAIVELLGERAREIASAIAHEVAFTNPFRPDAIGLAVPQTEIAAVLAAAQAAGASLLDDAALEALRIEAGEPKWGAELTEDVIPLEAGLRRVAISETKGCYTGQEVIIRILHRGHVNRHLRGIIASGDQHLQAGDELALPDGKMVGRITSACVSRTVGHDVALAYVRREVEMPGTLLLNGAEVHVVELPFVPAVSGASQ